MLKKSNQTLMLVQAKKLTTLSPFLSLLLEQVKKPTTLKLFPMLTKNPKIWYKANNLTLIKSPKMWYKNNPILTKDPKTWYKTNNLTLIKKSKDVMKSRSGQIVKLSKKAQEALTQDPPATERRLKVENLIFYLTELLNNWDTDEKEREVL